jgi:hypothetical protein
MRISIKNEKLKVFVIIIVSNHFEKRFLSLSIFFIQNTHNFTQNKQLKSNLFLLAIY